MGGSSAYRWAVIRNGPPSLLWVMVMSWVTLVTAFRDNPRGLLVTHLRIHNEKKRQRFVRFSVLFHFFLQERSLFI